MLRPLQPHFKIRVLNGGNASLDKLKSANVIEFSDTYIDIEQCVAFPVTYEEQSDLLNTLHFTVDKYADILLYYFHIGQKVVLYGGYYTDNQEAVRHVFSGTVTRIRTHFSDNGRISFNVECMNYGYTKLGKDPKNFVYPDTNSNRTFAQGKSLSLETIVRGIAEENNFEVGEINLSTSAKNVDISKINVQYQKNISDWKFLTMLAQNFGCSVWISTEDGVEKLNFVSHEKAAKKQSDISFVYPLYGLTDKNFSMSPTFKDSEMQRFDDPAFDRPRILRDVSVDEDLSQAYSVSRSAVYFDKQTGEYKDSLPSLLRR